MKKPHSPIPPVERRQSSGRRRLDTILPNFRDLIDNAVQGILIHSNFKPLYANKMAARIFGFENEEEILSLPLIRPLIPPENWAQAEEEYGAMIRGERRATMRRMRAQKRDGSEIWLTVTERAIDWYGTAAVQVTGLDITAHVRTEEEMMDAEQRLRSMLEILPAPVYITRRRDGKILFVNRKTCLLFHQSAGPLLRGKEEDFFLDEKDHANLHQLLDTVPDIREVEVRMKTAEGKEFTAEIAAIIMDYLGEPAVLVALNDISQRKQLEAELFHQASTDPLTGISNRRYFLLQAEQDLRRAQRFTRELSVLMIDLDHFKTVNDRLGHAAGDVVLESVVKACLAALRQADVMGRLGGEEFGVILPETDMPGAKEVAERIRKNVREKAVITPKGVVEATISVGVATYREGDTSVDELFHRADQALYRAKDRGRDCVVLDDSK